MASADRLAQALRSLRGGAVPSATADAYDWLAALLNGDEPADLSGGSPVARFAAPIRLTTFDGVDEEGAALTDALTGRDAPGLLVRGQHGKHAEFEQSGGGKVAYFYDSGVELMSTAIDGTLDVTGAATLGSTLDVAGATTLGSTLDVAGAATFDGAVTLGDAAADAIAVHGTPTFNAPATFKHNVAIQNAGGTVLAAFDVTAGAQKATLGAAAAPGLYVDVANGRTLVGTTTALTGAADDKFAVVGGTAHFAGNSGPSIGLRYNAAQTAGWTVGVAAAGANAGLEFKDDGGAAALALGDASAAYQATVTGNLNVTGGSLNMATGAITLANNQGIKFTESGGTVRDSAIMNASNVTIFGHSGNAGTVVRGGYVRLQYATTTRLEVNTDGIGFLGATPVARPTVVGVRTGTLAELQTVVANLLTALGGTRLGLITDSTT